jgi:hypothetical protein
MELTTNYIYIQYWLSPDRDFCSLLLTNETRSTVDTISIQKGFKLYIQDWQSSSWKQAPSPRSHLGFCYQKISVPYISEVMGVLGYRQCEYRGLYDWDSNGSWAFCGISYCAGSSLAYRYRQSVSQKERTSDTIVWRTNWMTQSHSHHSCCHSPACLKEWVSRN